MSERARNLTRRLPAIPGALFAGLYVMGWGFREGLIVLRLRRRGLLAEGMVVENVRCMDDSGPSWAPVIAFTDSVGNHVEFTPRARGDGLGLSTGRTVQVIYLPEASQDARVNSWQHLLLPSLIPIVAGLFIILIMIMILVTF